MLRELRNHASLSHQELSQWATSSGANRSHIKSYYEMWLVVTLLGYDIIPTLVALAAANRVMPWASVLFVAAYSTVSAGSCAVAAEDGIAIGVHGIDSEA